MLLPVLPIGDVCITASGAVGGSHAARKESLCAEVPSYPCPTEVSYSPPPSLLNPLDVTSTMLLQYLF